MTKIPGKFLGCSPWVPFLWIERGDDLEDGIFARDSMENTEQSTEGHWQIIVQEEDTFLFPELTVGQILYFYEDDTGVVFEL